MKHILLICDTRYLFLSHAIFVQNAIFVETLQKAVIYSTLSQAGPLEYKSSISQSALVRLLHYPLFHASITRTLDRPKLWEQQTRCSSSFDASPSGRYLRQFHPLKKAAKHCRNPRVGSRQRLAMEVSS